jgi:hypothetical protein
MRSVSSRWDELSPLKNDNYIYNVIFITKRIISISHYVVFFKKTVTTLDKLPSGRHINVNVNVNVKQSR